ncbi:VrrA/YqfQ family protein [Jeotgalibacillus haloalkalitolerans]|uniref:VrrA/YqfQ family protein n=1 Tax=Jeotgalibacillus haloalkalitolerans TaxID=3104292 RepID=A0ABU5KLS8_9BACL|nr:VrrA/YqfQ family protein [Jeotgalibacillus sp. HH7-29]MDZ5712189.1 VrrA/YqfQ family protein [Jeotgalibacillus sp. HH7-29]
MYPYRPYPIPFQVVQTAPKTAGFSIASLQKWAGTAQQFINTAHRYMPYVQQYGPMIKNFPAMWKLYKAFNELDADESNVTDIKEDPKSESKAALKKEPVRRPESTPKLYI